MPVSREVVLERASATRDVQSQIAASWVWDELNVAGWDSQIDSLRAAQDSEAATRAEHLQKRGALDELLDDLEGRKVQGVGIARSRWRGEPSNLEMISGAAGLR